MMYDEPTYLVQVGHLGSRLAREAVKEGHADGAVLSPADYKYRQNEEISQNVKSNGGDILFDPQLYIPRTDRQDLTTYSYFEGRGGEDFNTGMFASQDERRELAEDLIAVQDDFEVDAYVSPARFLDSLTGPNVDRWLDLTESFIDVANESDRDIPVLASLPVNGFELNDDERKNRLLNKVTSLDPDGFYVSVMYDDLDVRLPLKGEENVYSYLDLHATLRKNRYEVIAAHTHQIAHLLLGIGVNAFSSGHYQNLRAFDTDRWVPSDEEEIRRQVVRYYSDALLDSIRVESQVEEIYKNSNISTADIRVGSPYETDLFEGPASPEESGWKFSGASWDHYVWSCNSIADRYRNEDLETRCELAENKVTEAKELYDELERELGELESVEDQIYQDWLSAYEEVTESIDYDRLKIMMRST